MQPIISRKKVVHFFLPAIFSLLMALIIFWASTPTASGFTNINTDDGQLDSNWSSIPSVIDSVNDSIDISGDIVRAWIDTDSAIPTAYYFRIELTNGPIGDGGTAQISFDCNNNNVFDDPSIDRVLNYWVGYEENYPGGAVWIQTYGVYPITEYTDAYGEAVGNNYEIRADAADLCPSTPFGVLFKVAVGADMTTPITFPPSNVNLILDDGSSETGQGYLFGANALQFLWFNRFTPPTSNFPFALERVNIQWIADGSGSSIGDAVDVYVWEDADGNPANGATFRGSVSGTVQATNGDFSSYLLDPPIVFCNAADILIGTVDRSVVSYVTGPKWPARVDSGLVTANRSWLGVYTADPGYPPALPANSIYEPINNGTWMIRGYGTAVPLSQCGIPQMLPNFNTGAPGSYFTITGSGFPADSVATVTVNNHVLGTLTTDSNGEFSIQLATSESDEGAYIVTITVNPSATIRLILSSEEPLRPQEGSGPILNVPAGIGLTDAVFLPILLR